MTLKVLGNDQAACLAANLIAISLPNRVSLIVHNAFTFSSMADDTGISSWSTTHDTNVFGCSDTVHQTITHISSLSFHADHDIVEQPSTSSASAAPPSQDMATSRAVSGSPEVSVATADKLRFSWPPWTTKHGHRSKGRLIKTSETEPLLDVTWS